jgi:DNA primase catalytic core
MHKILTKTHKSDLKILKTQIDLSAHIRSSGVQLETHGQNLVGNCPFHDDKIPSLVVTPAKNLWHCMGKCNTGGTVIDWEMRKRNLDFKEAVEYLKEKYSHLFNGKKQLKEKLITGRELLNEQQTQLEEAERQKILKQCIEYFHRNIKQTPAAFNYLEKRGLVYKDFLDEFHIGCADKSFTDKLPTSKEGRDIKGKLKQLGILTKTGRLLFNSCIVFPVFDNNNNILNIYGRTIVDRKDRPSHFYLAGMNKGLFNHRALISKEIILTESIIDALSFWVHGFRNVTCSYGANGMLKAIPAIFKEAEIERVYLAYDNDEAGNKAVDALFSSLAGLGIEVLKIEFPDGLDANDYINRVKSPEESLRLLIQSAQPLNNGHKPAKDKKDSALFNDILQKKGSGNGTGAGVLERHNGVYYYNAGDRRYKLLGLEKNLNSEYLKVYLKADCKNKFHLDNNIDLYSAKDRRSFIRNTAEELELDIEIIKKDVGNLVKLAEEKQAEIIKESHREKEEKELTITEQEKEDALAYLKNPDLIQNIIEDFKRCGIVGEEENTLNGYIAATSRKEDRPLAVIIQSSSGAGKTTLMDAILAFMPSEDVVKFSAMTGQSLFYMGEKNLKNKILAIVEEEGAEKASYSLKVLQSEGKISIASTGKDPDSGRHITQEYIVEGPVMLIITTTNCDIDPELLSRCIVLTINESREQTKRIHKIQRKMETLEGMFMELGKEKIIKRHQNAQRLLCPIRVHNPYAKYLTFMDANYRARRDQLKYLTLIRTITLIHQYQREVKTMVKNSRVIEYIETTLDDIELANQLAGNIFRTTLDELSPQTRAVLEKIYEYVTAVCSARQIDQQDFRFSRRQLREHLNIGNSQLAVHLDRLVEYEYLIVHRGKRGQTFVYELLYDDQNGLDLSKSLGLLDIDRLKKRKKA